MPDLIQLDPAPTESLEDLLRDTTFDVVVRGYARDQVDAYLAHVEARLAANREYITELEEQVRSLQRQLRERDEPSYTGLGARVRTILQLAEEEAAEVKATARAEADRHRQKAMEQASKTAAAMVRNATKDADEIRAAAEQEAERVRAELAEERAELDRRIDELDTRLNRLREVLADVPDIDPDRDRVAVAAPVVTAQAA